MTFLVLTFSEMHDEIKYVSIVCSHCFGRYLEENKHILYSGKFGT